MPIIAEHAQLLARLHHDQLAQAADRYRSAQLAGRHPGAAGRSSAGCLVPVSAPTGCRPDPRRRPHLPGRGRFTGWWRHWPARGHLRR